MKRIILFIMCSMLLGCGKESTLPNPNDCFMERDSLQAENAKLKTDISYMKLTMESSIRAQVESRQRELYRRIESYNSYINEAKVENQDYRGNLRMIFIISLIVIIACVVIINLILIKMYKQKTVEKKLYEE